MKHLRIVLSLLALVGMAGVASALDFSADVVTSSNGQRSNGKIFVSADKTRMDMAGNTTITRMDKQVAWMIMPEQRMYIEQAFDPDMMAGATEKMPGEIERTALGSDTFDGKACVKYRITYTSRAGQATVIQWVDDASLIPVKTEAADGSWSMEYRNLKTGAQDASIFEIPAGYKKFALPDMADIMRAAGKEHARGGE